MSKTGNNDNEKQQRPGDKKALQALRRWLHERVNDSNAFTFLFMMDASMIFGAGFAHEAWQTIEREVLLPNGNLVALLGSPPSLQLARLWDVVALNSSVSLAWALVGIFIHPIFSSADFTLRHPAVPVMRALHVSMSAVPIGAILFALSHGQHAQDLVQLDQVLSLLIFCGCFTAWGRVYLRSR